MSKYIIKVQPGNLEDQDMNLDHELQSGVETDGFLLITFEQGEVSAMALQYCTVLEIAQAIAHDRSKGGTWMRQACAIAEGLMRSDEIGNKDNKERMARDLVDMLKAKD